MNRQLKVDAVVENSHTTNSDVGKNNKPAHDFHGFLMGHIVHQNVTHARNKKMKLFLVVPIVVMIMVTLHILGALFLSTTGSSAFSFSNPISYIMIGLLLVFAVFKLKHLLGLIRRKEKLSVPEISNGISDTSSMLDEQHQKPLP
jgi:hypothetical protein